MSKLRVHAFGVSIDGYGAGPDQSLDDPLGKGGPTLHRWFYPTRTFQQMFGKERGKTEIRALSIAAGLVRQHDKGSRSDSLDRAI